MLSNQEQEGKEQGLSKVPNSVSYINRSKCLTTCPILTGQGA